MTVPAAPNIQIRRHYSELSEDETDAVVEIVADLIVSFLKHKPEPAQAGSTEASARAKETDS